MNTLPAQEIKRRGVKAIELALKNGPVHIIKNNSPACVVLTEAQYTQLTTPHPSPKSQKDNLLQRLLHKKSTGDKTRTGCTSHR
jgi:PHD/YefM family antitoxin component YafN of YafNO toxin-antitoxin module